MSENPSQPELPENDETLESLLKRLEPSKMDLRVRDSLLREQRILAMDRSNDPSRIQWSKVLPLTLACCVAMVLYGSYRYGNVFSDDAETVDTVAEQRTPVEIDSSPPSPPASPGARVGGFLPVSSQEFLINSSSEGVVETEDGPREKMNLEFRDAYHWHDPNTGTNIRYFQPRKEQVIIPLRTD